MKAIKTLLAVLFLTVGISASQVLADEPIFEDEKYPYASTLEDN